MALKFSSIKSLFVTEEEEVNPEAEKKVTTKKENTKKEATAQKNSAPADSSFSWKSTSGTDQNTSDFSTQTTVPTEGKFSPKIFESLTKAISKANLPGEDYLEFMQALKAMKDLPLEESVKIQTVFATLSGRGLTKAKVLETGDFYIKVLEKEKDKFYSAFNSQAKTGIAKKQKEISSIEASNLAKAEQIKKLTQEITQNQQKMEKLKIEMSGAEAKMKSTENNFILTYDKVANQIKENLSKVNALP